MSKPIRSAGYRSATQAVYSEQAQHNSVAQLVSLEFTDSTCECRRLVQFIFVGAVYHNALSNCAALLCRTQRRVAHMCSSAVSDTANRLRKTRKKKSSVVHPVSQRSHVGNLHQIRKQGKGRSSKRKENRRLSFLFAPAAGAARSRRPQTANPPLRFSEKLPAR